MSVQFKEMQFINLCAADRPISPSKEEDVEAFAANTVSPVRRSFKGDLYQYHKSIYPAVIRAISTIKWTTLLGRYQRIYGQVKETGRLVKGKILVERRLNGLVGK